MGSDLTVILLTYSTAEEGGRGCRPKVASFRFDVSEEETVWKV